MSLKTLTTNPENLTIQEIFPRLDERFEPRDVQRIERALAIAREAHTEQRRMSGAPYVTHVIGVSQILYELQMDPVTIAAGLLHDTLEDTPVTEAHLREEFGEELANLVQGVTKISAISARGHRRRQVESLRKMILFTAQDIRVVIIKLADRLHNMRTLRWLPPAKRTRIASDTLDIYAPLASRLGMARIKSELEDMCMRWLQPEAYEYIAGKVAKGRATRERTVQRFVEQIERLLDENGIPHSEISGRPKHFYSIWSKMQRQELSFNEVFDLLALRIVTETVSDCYDIVGIVHGEWRPIPGHFNDYISVPKDNLYQALHTNVIGLDGEVVEIQIRTREMHRVAELGVAAHWKYKEGHGHSHELDEKLVWLRGLVDLIQDVRDPREFLDALQGEVFADTVFCFTPQGDVIELPRGSTAIDFAYNIHSEVGNTCMGVRINRRMAPLRTEVKSGDVVEIITSKSGHPSRSWLAFAKTSRARNKIRHWLRSVNQEDNRTTGRDMLIRALRGRGVKLSPAEISDLLVPHLADLQAKSFDELCAEIGFGTVPLNRVVNRIAEAVTEPQDSSDSPPPAVATPDPVSTEGVRVAGVGGAVVRFSQCCKPAPGDQIVGFVTRGRGVSIHRADCAGLGRLLASPQNADRIIEVTWGETAQEPREIEIRVVARDRTGLLADLSQAITERGIFIKGSSSRSNRDATATLRFTLLVRSNNQLNAMMERLRRVKGVHDLTRVEPGSTRHGAKKKAGARRGARHRSSQ